MKLKKVNLIVGGLIKIAKTSFSLVVSWGVIIFIFFGVSTESLLTAKEGRSDEGGKDISDSSHLGVLSEGGKDSELDPEVEEIIRLTRESREKETEMLKTEKSSDQQEDKVPSRNQCKYVSGLSTRPPTGTIVLTFDDGPDPKTTPQILEILKFYNIRASFFLLGKKVKAYPSLVEQIREEGHIIGNHSFTHVDFHTIGGTAQKEEIDSTNVELKKHTDTKEVDFFRYPYGNSTCLANEYLHSLNMGIVGWHVDSCDWGYEAQGFVNSRDAKICEVQNANRKDFVQHVLDSVNRHHGGIILFHDRLQRSVSHLKEILSGLQEDGYEFTTPEDDAYANSIR